MSTTWQYYILLSCFLTCTLHCLTFCAQEDPDEYLLMQDLISLAQRGVENVSISSRQTVARASRSRKHSASALSSLLPATKLCSTRYALLESMCADDRIAQVSVTIIPDDEPFDVTPLVGIAGRYVSACAECAGVCACVQAGCTN